MKKKNTAFLKIIESRLIKLFNKKMFLTFCVNNFFCGKFESQLSEKSSVPLVKSASQTPTDVGCRDIILRPVTRFTFCYNYLLNKNISFVPPIVYRGHNFAFEILRLTLSISSPTVRYRTIHEFRTRVPLRRSNVVQT